MKFFNYFPGLEYTMYVAKFMIYFGFCCTLSSVYALRVGHIDNTSLVINCSHLVINVSTCNNCLCTMLGLSVNKSVVSLNCRVKSNVSVNCQLFTTESYSSSCFYRLENSSNSTFYFTQLPASNQSMTAPSATVTRPAETTASPLVCNSSCVNQSWSLPVSLLASWSFDGIFSDQTGNYNLSPTNSPSFSNNGIVRQAIFLNASGSQYLTTRYIPLVNSSFTVDAWINPTEFRHRHNSIFGVCFSASTSRCLHITMRSYTTRFSLHFSFYGNDCFSNTPIVLNKWIHVAFTFDISSMTRFIYINGEIDTRCSSTSSPLIITNGTSYVGDIPNLTASGEANFFQGFIDQVTVSKRVKSTCEILEAATLIARFTFNNDSLLHDFGPNSLSTYATSYSVVIDGHVRQAISFPGSASSYFQVSDVNLFGFDSKAFSISLWVKPQSLAGVLVHFSSASNGSSGWCFPFLGFHANGSLIAQIYSNQSLYVIAPNLLPLSPSWSHIVQTWSQTSGLRLYINNVLAATLASAVNFDPSFPTSVYMELARTLLTGTPCPLSRIATNRSYAGAIDDLTVYRRELSATDICTLYTS